MNDTREFSRSGLAKALLIIAAGIFGLLALGALLLPPMCGSREGNRRNTCRNNMRALANAMFTYSTRHGHYPGYMNALERFDRRSFSDPTRPGSTESLPVSWAVMILTDIDRQSLFEQWRKDPAHVPPIASGTGPKYAPTRFYVDQYIEDFLCSSDEQATRSGTPISYVVNTGLPDLPAAIGLNDAPDAMPRDWPANGMFFDQFTEHELVKPHAVRRGPMVVMSDARVVDPKDKTILLTENVDATSYVLRAGDDEAEHWRHAEVQVGCTWQPGPVGEAKPASLWSNGEHSMPSMTPPSSSLHPNVDIGRGDGRSYEYCRPSSRHPESFNVAFVGQNVQGMRDKISYFVYAKLMASDDENIRLPGMSAAESNARIDARLRTHELFDEDINP